ncbi:MAG: PTS sugar transporter subunit IIC [Calditrichia bacterium]
MNIAILSAIISFLSLDITIAFQVLISSPLFACPILGWLLGDVWLGFELGFLFQLLWLGRIPAGAYIVPEGNIASMVAAGLVLLNHETAFPHTTLMLAFLEGILVSYLGALLTFFYRKLNGRILDFIMREVDFSHFKRIPLLEAASGLIYFLMVYVLTYSFLRVNELFLPEIIRIIGRLFEEQLIVVKPIIMGIGLAFVIQLLREAVRKNLGKKIEKTS